jgi:hypothetical protein
MITKRQQLTLFISKTEATVFENIRKLFNPVQHALIAAHVTLCRDEEMAEPQKLLASLRQLRHQPLTIHFGNVARFAAGRGVLIPAEGDNSAFQQLRKKILQGIVETPALHQPHITLMHPRNSTCTDEIFAQIEKQRFPASITFGQISLIEQEEGKQWKVLDTFLLEEPDEF